MKFPLQTNQRLEPRVLITKPISEKSTARDNLVYSVVSGERLHSNKGSFPRKQSKLKSFRFGKSAIPHTK